MSHCKYGVRSIRFDMEATSHIDQLAAPYPFQLECFRRWYYYNAARTNATAKPNGCMIKFAHCDGRSIRPRSCQNRYLQFATEMGWYVLSLISFTISKSPLHLSDLARIASYKSTSSQKKKNFISWPSISFLHRTLSSACWACDVDRLTASTTLPTVANDLPARSSFLLVS